MKNRKLKKYVISLCFIVLLIIAAARYNAKADISRFPLELNGKPKQDIVMINGKAYKLNDIGQSYRASKIESTIEVKADKDKRIEVVLPKRGIVSFWSIDEKKILSLISYERIDPSQGIVSPAIGESWELQRFVLNIPSDKAEELLFKLSNIDEAEKSFNDREEDYLLKVKVN